MPVQHMVLRYKDIHAFDNYKTMQIIYSMYRAVEVSVHLACYERATQPYSRGGGGTSYILIFSFLIQTEEKDNLMN